jgi:hypothetical protein
MEHEGRRNRLVRIHQVVRKNHLVEKMSRFARRRAGLAHRLHFILLPTVTHAVGPNATSAH